MQAAATGTAYTRKMYQIVTKHDSDDNDGGKALVFPEERAAIEDVIATPTHAFLFAVEAMYAYPEYRCDMVTPWVDSTVYLNSMTFAKSSPHFSFINFRLLQRLEHGLLTVLQRRYFELDTRCISERNVSLSFFKSISLFGIVATGLVAATAIFLAEWIWPRITGRLAKDSAEEFVLNVAPTTSQPYEEDDLKLFMFKWGINDRENFLRELDNLRKKAKN